MATRKESDKCFQYLGFPGFQPMDMEELQRLVREKEPDATTDEERTMLMNAIRSNSIYDQGDDETTKWEKINYYFARTEATELFHNDEIEDDNLLVQFMPIIEKSEYTRLQHTKQTNTKQTNEEIPVVHFYPQPVMRYMRTTVGLPPSWLQWIWGMDTSIIEEYQSLLYTTAINNGYIEVSWNELPRYYHKYLPSRSLPFKIMRFLIKPDILLPVEAEEPYVPPDWYIHDPDFSDWLFIDFL